MIPSPYNIKTITDMRERALELLNQVEESREPVFLFHRSKPKAVVLSLKEFKEMTELIEALEDSLLAKKLEKRVGRGRYFSLKAIEKKVK